MFSLPQLSIIYLKVKWPLLFAFNYTQSVTQHYKHRTAGEVPLQSIQPPQRVQTILSSQISISDSKVKWPLRFTVHLFSAHYTALQLKNLSAINPVTMENMNDSRFLLISFSFEHSVHAVSYSMVVF